MSYILDALQRAEAERGQGQVPGLHSPPPPPHHTPSPTAARPGRQWVVAATLLACVVALVLWLGLLGAPAPQAVPAPAPAPAPVPAPLAVAQPTAPRVEAPPAAPASPKASAPSAPPKRPPPAEKTPPEKAAAPASTHPVPLLAELPEALRRDVPALHITGAVYSANPAQRLLVVNNQVLNQGSQAAPGVVLEEIQPHSAVFSANGTRFRLSH